MRAGTAALQREPTADTGECATTAPTAEKSISWAPASMS
jgi:hypothetical protein